MDNTLTKSIYFVYTMKKLFYFLKKICMQLLLIVTHIVGKRKKIKCLGIRKTLKICMDNNYLDSKKKKV